MRSVIAGVVGGVGGGATVLAALVMMGEHRTPMEPTGPTDGTDVSFAAPGATTGEVQGSSQSADGAHAARATSDIDRSVQAHEAEATSGLVEQAWVMPKALTDAIATEGWRAYARPARDDTASSAGASHAVSVREPAPAADSPTAADQVAQSASSVVDPSREPTIQSAVEPASTELSPIPAQGNTAPLAESTRPPEPAIAAETLTEPGRAIQAQQPVSTRPAVREPEELRALRSFRLNVPKELPKVDLAVQAGSPAPAAQLPARATGASTGTSASRRTSGALPVAARPVVTAARTAPASAPVPTAAETAAASGQESLKRASDAVKRLSRRMGGGYVR